MLNISCLKFDGNSLELPVHFSSGCFTVRQRVGDIQRQLAWFEKRPEPRELCVK